MSLGCFKKETVLSSAFFILPIILLAACSGLPSSSGNDGGGGNPPDPPAGVTLQSVTVSPATATVDVGSTQQFTASGNYSDGSTKDLTQTAAWTSSNQNIATVDAKGVMTAVAAGSSTITATSDSVSGSASATVNQAQQSSGVNVTTWHNDQARTGANTQETILTPANVNQDSFGKLFQFALDGNSDVQAQPLYVSNLMVNGKTRNVLFVAAQNDVVYAFDADGATLDPLWERSFVDPANGITVPVAPGDTGGSSCCPANPGITGTPVIDVNTNTMYLVARTKENGTQVQRLYALDIQTGAIKKSTAINPSVSGTGDKNFLSTPGTSATTVVFNNATENQRPGLVLVNGMVYVMYGSHSDAHPYHGWVIGYDASSLEQEVVWNATPNGQAGGIWMSGGSPAADSNGNLYFSTGNGDFDPSEGNYAQSWIKLSGDGQVLSYFTPYNWAALNGPDLDVAGAGPSLILPDQAGANPHLLVSVDKNGTIYLLDRDNMGGHDANDNSNVVQTICDAFPGRTDCSQLREEKDDHIVRSSPAYWNGYVYFGGQQDNVKAFQLVNGKLTTSPVSKSPTILGFPGATPSVSANGNSNGIVWVIDNGNNGSAWHSTLRAYDATDLSKELYNSRMNLARDDTGTNYVRFTVPTIANGKVYVISQGRISVYGLLK